eukprot:258898_1
MPNQRIETHSINYKLRDLNMEDVIGLFRFVLSIHPENPFTRQELVAEPENASRMQKYKRFFFSVISEHRQKHPQKMGGLNKPVTSDMTYVGAKNQKGSNDNIQEFQETNVYTIMNITFNEKRRHTQRSKVVRSESIHNVGGFADEEVYYDSPWWFDGCGISHSVYMAARWDVGSCNHKEMQYTNPQTINNNALNRISNNNVENAHIPLKLGNKTRRGFGARCGVEGKKNRQKWSDYLDWRNTFTNATPIDSLIVFIGQLRTLYNIK